MSSNEPPELERIPGIGPKRAQALNEAGYESLADLQEAEEAELLEVDRIDDILARDIKATVSPRLRHRPNATPTNEITPESWAITDKQAAYLEAESGLDLREYVGAPAIDLIDEFDWEIDPDLLVFKRVCGRVIKRDSTTGEAYPVPNATVHVYDTDCNFLAYYPDSSPWGWFYPYGCYSEDIATVTTDDCGRFCVYIPRWEIDRVHSARRERVCLPDVVRPRLEDILDHLDVRMDPPIVPEPRPRPDPAPFDLHEPGVYNQLSQFVGEHTTERLLAMTGGASVGDSTAEVEGLLDELVPVGDLDPPLPEEAPELELDRTEMVARTAALETFEPAGMEAADFVGPFLRCRDVYVPEWTTITDVPDVTFEVTQDVDGDGTAETIYSEGFFDVRWDDIPDTEVVLEASEMAQAATKCDPDVELGDCEQPELRIVGAMPLAPGYHSNGTPREGYALRPNRPRPGSKQAATPYGGTLNLRGCGFRTDEAEHYRLVYRYRERPGDTPTDPQPFTECDWHAVRENWPPATEHIMPLNDEGWYEIPDPSVIADRDQNLLLHWNTQRDDPNANGLYDVRLELGDADPKPLGEHSDWVTLWVDNTGPTARFDDLEWQTADGTVTGDLPLECPVIERPLDDDGTPETIEIDVSYTVKHRHLRSLSLDANGCGAGSPTASGPADDYSFWYSSPSDTHASVNDATFTVDGDMPPGAYTIRLDAWSRAFNPTRATGGVSKDWEIDPRFIGTHRRLQIAIVDSA